MDISFHGAAGSVTGSRFLVRAGRTRILVDCGLFKQIPRIPIVLVGRQFWHEVLDAHVLLDRGLVAEADLADIRHADDAIQAWELLREWPD